MLNEVHAPPLEPEYEKASKPASRSAADSKLDRAHELDRKSEHRSAGVDLIYAEPEDRGDSFNTTMSAIVVGIVLLVIVGSAWMMWK